VRPGTYVSCHKQTFAWVFVESSFNHALEGQISSYWYKEMLAYRCTCAEKKRLEPESIKVGFKRVHQGPKLWAECSGAHDV
jgi:hypothetical protein